MSKVENSEILKEQVGISSTISAAEEESKENFDRESIKLDGKEAGEGFLDLTNGNYGFTHTDTESMGEVLDVEVAHIFDSRNKASEQEEVKLKNGAIVKLNKGGLGEGFRTNYNQFLVKDTTGIVDGDEVSERFIYVDGKGDKHIFEEKYFYKDSEGKKNYVQKDEITIDMDKNLWHEENGTKYEVEKEVTDGNLKLVAKLEGITGLENIDTDIEEIAQVKSQIKEIQEYIASCNKQLYLNGLNDTAMGYYKKINGLQEQIQEKSIANARQDISDQWDIYEEQKAYDTANKNYTDEADKKLDDTLQGLKTSLNTAEENLREESYAKQWGSNFASIDYSDVNKLLNTDEKFDYQKSRIYGSTRRQNDVIKLNADLLKKTKDYNDAQDVYQDDKSSYESIQIQNKIDNYLILLSKKQQELKELERQVPVHYIVDEDGRFMGFGKIDLGVIATISYDDFANATITEPMESNIFRLIAIGDNYENTVFVSYDEKAEEENRIVIISHSNNKQIDFEYANNKLVKIVDSFGNVTKFEYDKIFEGKELKERKLKSITNVDEVTRFVYNGDDLKAVIDNNGDGFSMTKVGTEVTIKDITENEKVSVSDSKKFGSGDLEVLFGEDKRYFVEYKPCIVNFVSALKTTLTDEKGNVKAYTFNKKGETLSVVTTNSNNVEMQKEFNYIGENCTFTASPNLLATEYVEQGDIVLENGIAVKELLPKTITAINNSKATEFVFSAFAQGDSAVIERTCSMHDKADITNNTRFELRAEIEYEGEEEPQIDIQYCSFDYNNKGEQFLALPISIKNDTEKNKTLTSIKLIFDYSNNIGEATIRGMSFREGSWVHKTLEDNLVTEVKTSEGSIEKLNYDNKKLVSATLEKDGEKLNATFEYNKNGELVRTIDYFGMVTEKEFNDKGKLIKTSKYNINEPATRQVEETILDEKGRETKSVNELGEEVEGNGVSCTNSNGTAMEISSAVNGKDNSNVLSYTLGVLTKVSHNGFDWGYAYDYKKRLTKVDLCGEEYLTKKYDDKANTTITSLNNGEEFTETFDADGNIVKIECKKKVTDKQGNESLVYEKVIENTYNDFGKLSSTTENGVETIIDYDKFGNVIQTSGKQNGKAFVISGEYDKDKTIEKRIAIDRPNSNVKEIVTNKMGYDEQDRLTSVDLLVGELVPQDEDKINDTSEKVISQTLAYDGLGRIKTEVIGKASKEISYVKKNERTCNLVAAVDYALDGKTSDTIEYTYDKNGNIIKIEENGNVINRYEYDSIGRLTREDNKELNRTITYAYDKGGNIRRKKEHAFTLDSTDKVQEIACVLKKDQGKNGAWIDTRVLDIEYDYSYATSGNRDMLMEYCGKKFEYDSIGNPKVYMDKKLVFTKGRQLVELNDTMKKFEFKYNAQGLRTQKLEINTQTGNTFITDYYLDGKNIVREERSRKYDNGTAEGGKTLVRTMNYHYGATGLIGFSIKGEYDYKAIEYLYEKNIQGDIIGIVDMSGNKVVKYNYTAFGKQKISYLKNDTWFVIEGESYNDDSNQNYIIAVANPFRYRGYYFDIETNLYYLRSRYYDSELCRFVTIDDISCIDTEQINGINLYAYCGNNPVMNVDSDGKLFMAIFIAFLIGMAIGAVTSTITGLMAGKTGLSLLAHIGGGALLGGVMGGISALGGLFGIGAIAAKFVGVGLAAAAAVSFGAGILSYGLNEVWGNPEKEWDWKTAFAYGGITTVQGMLNFGIGALMGHSGNWTSLNKGEFRKNLKMTAQFGKKYVKRFIIATGTYIKDNWSQMLIRAYMKGTIVTPWSILRSAL